MRHYNEEVQHLVMWCSDNDLDLNTTKTMEIIVDYRGTRKMTPHPSHGEEVENVNIKFLGLYITNDLTWTVDTHYLVRIASAEPSSLRKLKKAKVPSQLLVNFYKSIIESILCHCITVWYTSCTIQNRRDLARIVKSAQRIVGTKLPGLDSIYANRLYKKASNIIKDSTHPGNRLFEPLPSGKRYREIRTRTNRLRNCFFPRAVVCITRFSLFEFPFQATTIQLLTK